MVCVDFLFVGRRGVVADKKSSRKSHYIFNLQAAAASFLCAFDMVE